MSYRLQGSSAFRINPNTGWIYLVQSLDRETVDRLTLTVFASDNGYPAATANASVLVKVLDDNDNDPRFEKDFYGFKLLENLPSGTLVGSVNATDPDLGKNSLLRYSVVQANSSFAVDPDTGKGEYPHLISLFFVPPPFAPTVIRAPTSIRVLVETTPECLRKPAWDRATVEDPNREKERKREKEMPTHAT